MRKTKSSFDYWWCVTSRQSATFKYPLNSCISSILDESLLVDMSPSDSYSCGHPGLMDTDLPPGHVPNPGLMMPGGVPLPHSLPPLGTPP